MGYPTRVQLIKRKASEQWYINFPSAVARAMEFKRSELVEWIIEDKEPAGAKKDRGATAPAQKTTAGSSTVSRRLWGRAKPPTARPGRGEGKKARPERAGLWAGAR